MSNNVSLTDELTGNTAIQTDHGALGFGDLVVMLLDAVLLIYTAWRSYDFLSTTVPNGFQMLALVGLWGLDIGALAWSIVWIFGSSETYQDWVSMAFFVVDLTGVVLTSLTDSLMYGAKGGAMTSTLEGVATVLIPLVVVGNVIAGFIYHFVSPQTKARRAQRKADAAHNQKMQEISAMERDLLYAEQYLLAKQDTLEKAVLLADIKTTQEAIEKETRAKLRDQIGIHNAAKSHGNGTSASTLDQLRERLNALNAKHDLSSARDEQSTAPVTSDSVPTPEPILQNSPVPHPIIPPNEDATLVPDSVLKGNGHKPSF